MLHPYQYIRPSLTVHACLLGNGTGPRLQSRPRETLRPALSTQVQSTRSGAASMVCAGLDVREDEERQPCRSLIDCSSEALSGSNHIPRIDCWRDGRRHGRRHGRRVRSQNGCCQLAGSLSEKKKHHLLVSQLCEAKAAAHKWMRATQLHCARSRWGESETRGDWALRR